MLLRELPRMVTASVASGWALLKLEAGMRSRNIKQLDADFRWPSPTSTVLAQSEPIKISKEGNSDCSAFDEIRNQLCRLR